MWVCKKRPRYSDDLFLLSTNDVLNAVICRSRGEEEDDAANQRFGESIWGSGWLGKREVRHGWRHHIHATWGIHVDHLGQV